MSNIITTNPNMSFLKEGKIITNDFSFNEQSLRIIDNPRSFIKSAASDSACMKTKDYLKTIKKEPGRTKLLALFLGAGEYYGSNKNGDWFSEADLKRCYPSFKKHGYLYKHHKNKDPEKKYGDIEFVTWNDAMKRVEGVFSMIDDLCHDELEKIENSEDIPVSMAAKLKYDVCSICGNKASKISDYCTHLKNDMNEIMPDGRKVYAINPNPIFFDISIVFRPADRTAYVLKKVANLRTRDTNFSTNKPLGFNSPKKLKLNKFKIKEPKVKKFHSNAMNKKSLLNKISELEKKIEGLIAGKVDEGQTINTMKRSINKEDMPDDTMKKLKEHPTKDVLSSSIKNKILLSLKEFLKLINEEDSHDSVSPMLGGGFSRLLDDDFIPDMMENDEDDHSGLMRIFKRLGSGRPLTRHNQKRRVIYSDSSPMRITIIKRTCISPGSRRHKGRGNKITIIKSSSYSDEHKISDLYNAYKFNFLAHNQSALNGLTVLADNYFI